MAGLTVDVLKGAGFTEIGCWSVLQNRLQRLPDLADRPGVYAFALGELVVYVGLASRSIRQRLGFYTSPGATQTTNIRLNAKIVELIRQGQSVQVLIAHPDDGDWNGLRLRGAEGLEAALIEDFDLPWNVKGRSAPLASKAKAKGAASRRSKGTTALAIMEFVAQNPNCTELQIAKGVFGPDAAQPRANPYCRRLVEHGKLRRLPTRPATYVVTVT